MRISDWSSDVCSAELVGAATGHIGGDRHGAGAAGLRDDVSFALVLLGVQHFVRNFCLLQQARQKLGSLDAGGTDQHGLLLGMRLLDLVDDRVELVLRVHEHRSEEHTSELQSLMRISYAVFCLKKQNNKQNQ